MYFLFKSRNNKIKKSKRQSYLIVKILKLFFNFTTYLKPHIL